MLASFASNDDSTQTFPVAAGGKPMTAKEFLSEKVPRKPVVESGLDKFHREMK